MRMSFQLWCWTTAIIFLTFDHRVPAHKTNQLSVRGNRHRTRTLAITDDILLRKGKKHGHESPTSAPAFPTPPSSAYVVYSNHPVKLTPSPTSNPTPAPFPPTLIEPTLTPSVGTEENFAGTPSKSVEPSQEQTELERACQAISDGTEFATPFHMELIYYYEIKTYQENPIDLISVVGSEIRELLSIALVDCEVTTDSASEMIQYSEAGGRRLQTLGVGNGNVDSIVVDTPCVALLPSTGGFCSIAKGSFVFYLDGDSPEVRSDEYTSAITELHKVFDEASFASASSDASFHFIGTNLSEYQSLHRDEKAYSAKPSTSEGNGFRETMPSLWITLIVCFWAAGFAFFVGRRRMNVRAHNSKGILLEDDDDDIFSLHGFGGSRTDEAWWTGNDNVDTLQTTESTVAPSSNQSSPTASLPAQFVIDDEPIVTGTNEIIRGMEKLQAARLRVEPASPKFVADGTCRDQGLEIEADFLDEPEPDLRQYSVENTVMF